MQRDLRRGPFPAAEPHRSVRDVEDLGVGLQSRPYLGRGFREEKVRPKAVVPGDHRGPFPGAAEQLEDHAVVDGLVRTIEEEQLDGPHDGATPESIKTVPGRARSPHG